jgi:hypothetical protein
LEASVNLKDEPVSIRPEDGVKAGACCEPVEVIVAPFTKSGSRGGAEKNELPARMIKTSTGITIKSVRDLLSIICLPRTNKSLYQFKLPGPCSRRINERIRHRPGIDDYIPHE